MVYMYLPSTSFKVYTFFREPQTCNLITMFLMHDMFASPEPLKGILLFSKYILKFVILTFQKQNNPCYNILSKDIYLVL